MFPPTITPRSRKSRLNSALLTGPLITLGVLSVLVLAAEITCRAILYWRTPAAMVFDTDTLYAFEPHSSAYGITFNDIGCIGDDLLQSRNKSDFVVLLIGGSTSFSPEYVAGVKRNLNMKSEFRERSLRVASCGRPRYTSEVMANLLDVIVSKVRPNVIGLYLGINDNIYNAFPSSDAVPSVGFFDYRRMDSFVSWRMFHYYVVQKAILSRPDFVGTELRSVTIMERNLQRILSIARHAHASLAVVSFAVSYPTDDEVLANKIRKDEPLMRHFWGNIESTVYGVKAHNALIDAWATSNRIPISEFAGAVERSTTNFLDICHMTNSGYEVLSRKMSEAIVEATANSR